MTNLFVYGTLQFPQVVKKLTNKNFKSKQAILKDHKIYQIDPADKDEMCPAIIPEKNSIVEGKILFDVDDKSLDIINFFESDKYAREILTIQTKDNQTHKALVFVWKNYLKEELKGKWDIKKFEKNYLNDCLKNTLPQVIKEYKKQD